MGRIEKAGLYIKDMVYGANDGIVTTFAVVAGVTGGGLEARVVLTIGVASLFADGFSMAASDYLGSRSEADARENSDLAVLPQRSAVKGAALTFVAFVLAGAVPLLPYIASGPRSCLFLCASAATAATLTVVGALRAIVTGRSALFSAAEMLTIGGIAAALAYGIGYQIQGLLH